MGLKLNYFLIIMVNAWFRVDIRHTCDYRVDASMNTMKIPNMVHTMFE
jgi:hypothetical protein